MSPDGSRIDRRHALRLLAGAVLAPALALPLRGAGAFRRWCRSDPVVRIAGQTADVYVSVFVANRRVARALSDGPIRLTLTVPHGVGARHLSSDLGFGDGYEVTFAKSTDLKATDAVVPVGVTAVVPLKNPEVAVRVEFTPRGRGRLRRGSREGTANTEIAFVAG